MNYHVWGAMLEAYCKLKTKPKTIAELKEAFQVIWGNLPQGPIDGYSTDLMNYDSVHVSVKGYHKCIHWHEDIDTNRCEDAA